MLYKFEAFDQIDPRRLMDVYQESNTKNIDYFYPDARDKMATLPQLEENSLHFIETDFFSKPGSVYFVLEASGAALSASTGSRRVSTTSRPWRPVPTPDGTAAPPAC